jgi:peptidyl-prolyl cis-trans isomerase B (cyclophilin B)
LASVNIETNHGNISFHLLPELAPEHVRNFVKLANEGFYDGTLFHRVIPGFMIQGGDPTTKDPNRKSEWGMGGPGYTINAEFNSRSHLRGIVSMARATDPNSAGSQFFIMHANNTGLDHQYSVFGEVTEGMDIVDKIAELPRDGECPSGEGAKMIKVSISE